MSSANGGTPVFTATEKRLMKVLSDHLPHRPRELLACLNDPQFSRLINVQDHLSNIRTKIRPHGHEIVCEIYNRTVHYRWVFLRTPVEILTIA